MSLHTALSGADLTNAAGAHTIDWHLDTVQDTTIGTATVVSVDFANALINISSPSAGWLNSNAGNTAVITNGSTLRGVYRLRLNPTNSILYIMEIGNGDPGLINIPLRTAGIQPGDTITVCDRDDVWSVIPFIDAATGNIYEDFNQTVASDNYTPGPVVNIQITTQAGQVLYGDCAVECDPGQTYATLTFTALPMLWPTSLTVTTFAWSIPLSWTVTSGSVGSATFTARVPVQNPNYTLACVLTENNGIPRMGRRYVWVRDATHPWISVTSLDELTVDRTGARFTVTLNADRLASLPATGDALILWGTPRFNGQVIASAWCMITGYVTNVNAQTDPGLRTATITAEGPASILQKIGAYSQYFAVTGGLPANWQQIVNSLAYGDYIIFWLAAVRDKNTVRRYNWTTSNVTNTSQDLPQWKIEAGGNAFTQMQNVAGAIRCNVGTNPDGEMMVRRHPSLIAYASRGASVITRFTMTSSMYKSVRFNQELKPKVRRVRGEAFAWDGASALPTPYLADAPGATPGQAVADERLQGQIVDTQAELNQVTGDQWAFVNNPYSNIDIELPGLWVLLIYCAEMSFIRLQVPAELSPDGIAKDLNVIPRSITLRSNDDGTYDGTLNAEGETAGVPAVTVPVPPQAAIPNNYNTLMPPAPQIVNGGWGRQDHYVPSDVLWMAYTSGAVYRTAAFNGSPVSVNISPADAPGGGYYLLQNPYNFAQWIGFWQGSIRTVNNPWTQPAFPAATWTTVYTPPADRILAFWGKMADASINRSGYFAWFERSNSTGHMWYVYTTNNFASTSAVEFGGGYPGDAQLGLCIGCFNSGTNGFIAFFGAADPGSGSTGGMYVWTSSNWGTSWSRILSTGTGWNAGNLRGGCNIPYSLPGGGANTNNHNIWFCSLTTVTVVNPDGTIVHAVGVDSLYPISNLLSFTLDGNILAFFRHGTTYLSSNGGGSWQAAPNSVSDSFINGWPTNPDFMIGGSGGSIKWTTDRLQTVQSVGVPDVPYIVIADLSRVYPNGGVHPTP